MSVNLKFSVIVPVYRTEEYLKECINSVLSQNYSNFELILIDNGASSLCKDIYKKFESDDRLVVEVFDENKGISRARNLGIKRSTGDYLLFLDSDDFYVNENVLSSINNLISEKSDAEVILLQTLLYNDLEKKFVGTLLEFDEKEINEKPLVSAIEYLVKSNKYVSCAWNKVVQKDFLIKNDLFFLDNIRGEDVEWYFRVMSVCCNFKSVGSHCYGNRLRTNSTQSEGYTDKIWLDIYSFLSNHMKKIDGCDFYMSLILDDLTKFYYIILAQSNGRNISPELFNKMLGLRKFESIAHSDKNKICKLMVSVLGLKMASKLIYKYTSRKKF